MRTQGENQKTSGAYSNAGKHLMTDHALLRWMEKVFDFNIVEAKNHALPEIVKIGAKCGVKSVKHGGMTYVLRDGLVVTVIDGTHYQNVK